MNSCTIDEINNLGLYKKTKGNYTGAVEMIQHRKADMISIPLYYPLMDPENKYFPYSCSILEDQMMIVCSYVPTEEGGVLDVMDTLTSVPSDLWWGTLVSSLHSFSRSPLGGASLKSVKSTTILYGWSCQPSCLKITFWMFAHAYSYSSTAITSQLYAIRSDRLP